MSCCLCPPLAQVGPLIGGFINQYIDWRWSFWVLLIWAGVMEILIIIFVPETYAPVLLRRKAQTLRKETGDDRWQAPIEKMDRSVSRTVLWSCIRPFQLLFFEQMCLNLCILSAILLGTLYLFFGVSLSHTCFTKDTADHGRPFRSSSKAITASISGRPA